MFCESYRETLNAAVVSGERLPAAAEAHLGGCVSCRAIFAEYQQLLGRIDGELRNFVNTEVPLSLLPRVREQIAGPGDRRAWFPALLGYGTTLAAFVAILFLYTASTKPPSPTGSSSTFKPSLEASGKTSVSPAKPSRRTKSRPADRPPGAHEAPKTIQAEVLISEDEQVGLRRYEKMLRERLSAAPTAAVDNTTLSMRPLEIAELDVKELSIAPLVKADEENSMKR